MKFTHRLLCGLHLFVGIGAVGGGLAGILNPQAPLGMPLELLQSSPFDNYLIPGLILFVIIGLGNLFSAYTFRLKSRYQGYISSVFSWALVIFIVVQCLMLNLIYFLHIIFFFVGLIMAGLAAIILYEQRHFPANLILRYDRNR